MFNFNKLNYLENSLKLILQWALLIICILHKYVKHLPCAQYKDEINEKRISLIAIEGYIIIYATQWFILFYTA